MKFESLEEALRCGLEGSETMATRRVLARCGTSDDTCAVIVAAAPGRASSVSLTPSYRCRFGRRSPRLLAQASVALDDGNLRSATVAVISNTRRALTRWARVRNGHLEAGRVGALVAEQPNSRGVLVLVDGGQSSASMVDDVAAEVLPRLGLTIPLTIAESDLAEPAVAERPARVALAASV